MALFSTNVLSKVFSSSLTNTNVVGNGFDSCSDEKEARVSWAHRGWMRLQRWQQLRHERRQLWRLSDAMLKDIGLSRADVEHEASRPFWDDANWRR